MAKSKRNMRLNHNTAFDWINYFIMIILAFIHGKRKLFI